MSRETNLALTSEHYGGHPPEVMAAHAEAMASSGFHSRFVEVVPGERTHVIEGGEGPAVVLLHGSGPSALLFLPLMRRLAGVRALAVDRPGFGLSDSHSWPTGRRQAAVDWVGGLLDAFGLDETAMVGSSAGGTWAIWFALAHPERVSRLIQLGAPPTLSVNAPPAPFRAVTSIDGENAPQPPRPTRDDVVQGMAIMGEAETIVAYPEQIAALVAAGSDRVAATASRDELTALISADGWQEPVLTPVEELAYLATETLLIWGVNDPLGGHEAATRAASAIPQARLEMLETGHAPWLGEPDATADAISGFIRGA